jgi:phage protein U
VRPFSAVLGALTILPKAPPEITNHTVVHQAVVSAAVWRAVVASFTGSSVPTTASGTRDEKSLVNGAMYPREVGKIDA